ncbi:MLP-like protein 328 isoform X1 [Punica granatum]|uniref:MLP-like protein 328 isoform X1 n=1 Tax=Punica granatum TaxID=22663 RepID=A0A6P8D632_PUNGR|nr:MLP-like protein 328 isoform X1 [Punica granatum]
MGLRGKLAAEIEIKSSAEAYFKRLKDELHHLPDAASGVHGVEVHEGDFKTHGSVKSWTYTLGNEEVLWTSGALDLPHTVLWLSDPSYGRTEIFKERFEIDERDMTVSMVAVDGHILQRYKSYKVIYKVIPKTGTEPAAVRVTLDYEKHKEIDADPHKEMEFMISMMKDIDKHLLGQ